MKNEYLQGWITKADNNLKVAEHEMNVDINERVTDAICFHCQQAVENISKHILFYTKSNLAKLITLNIFLNCAP